MTGARGARSVDGEELDPETPWTLNQLVAANLRRLRRARGWTQVELGARLAPYRGRELCQASVSALERSAAGHRICNFSANDMVALAQTFEVPVLCLLIPPHGASITAGAPGSPVLSSDELLGVVLGRPDNAGEWETVIAEWDEAGGDAANLIDPGRATVVSVAREVALVRAHHLIRRSLRCDLVDLARTIEQLAELVATVHELDDRRARAVEDDPVTTGHTANGAGR